MLGLSGEIGKFIWVSQHVVEFLGAVGVADQAPASRPDRVVSGPERRDRGVRPRRYGVPHHGHQAVAIVVWLGWQPGEVSECGKQIKQVDDHWVPYLSTMRDLNLGTHSVLPVVEVEIDPDLREGLFEVSELKRGN